MPGFIGIAPGASGSFTIGDSFTQCPMCGGEASFLNARYEFTDGMVVAIQQLGPAKAKQLIAVLIAAQKNPKKDAGSVLQDIEKIDPGLAAIVRRAAGGKLALAAVLVILWMLVKQCTGDGPLIDIDVNNFTTEISVQADLADPDDADGEKKQRNSDDARREATEKHRAEQPRIPDTIRHGPNRHEKLKQKAIAKQQAKRDAKARSKKEKPTD